MNLHVLTENLFFSVVYLSLTLDSPLDSHLIVKASVQNNLINN